MPLRRPYSIFDNTFLKSIVLWELDITTKQHISCLSNIPRIPSINRLEIILRIILKRARKEGWRGSLLLRARLSDVDWGSFCLKAAIELNPLSKVYLATIVRGLMSIVHRYRYSS